MMTVVKMSRVVASKNTKMQKSGKTKNKKLKQKHMLEQHGGGVPKGANE
jgi:hypothetical protein